jgi:hypothetical protein
MLKVAGRAAGRFATGSVGQQRPKAPNNLSSLRDEQLVKEPVLCAIIRCYPQDIMTKELIDLANSDTTSRRSASLEAFTTLVEKERKRPAEIYTLQCHNYSIEEAAIPRAAGAFQEIKRLRHLITICAWCNRVRDSEGLWQQAATDLQVSNRRRFSHGICPECAENSYNAYRLVTSG